MALTICAALFALHLGHHGVASQQPALPPIVQKFLAPPSEPLRSYEAVRRLTASTRGGRMWASMEVRTRLDPIGGFSYQVLTEEGSTVIRRKVLLAALEAEQRAFRSADAAGAALTPENYEFLAVTVATDRLRRIEVRPRRHHPMLIDGSLLIDNESADLVRVEGQLSKRPSFWTRRVDIVREYTRIDGVHVPVAMRSTADVLIVGSSSFSMTYRYTQINGRPVVDDWRGTTLLTTD